MAATRSVKHDDDRAAWVVLDAKGRVCGRTATERGARLLARKQDERDV